jgi:hypothetical protein
MSTLLEQYVKLRKEITRAAQHADAGDWEECLSALDEARRVLVGLERDNRRIVSDAWAASGRLEA